MQQVAAPDLISRQELCEAAGIDPDSLRRLRKWLFLEPAREFPGRGTGSVSYYPSITAPMIRRFYELRSGTRKIDECMWRLWVEGYPIPIRKWALGRLLPCESAIMAALSDIGDEQNQRDEIDKKVRKSVIAKWSTDPTRTSHDLQSGGAPRIEWKPIVATLGDRRYGRSHAGKEPARPELTVL